MECLHGRMAGGLQHRRAYGATALLCFVFLCLQGVDSARDTTITFCLDGNYLTEGVWPATEGAMLTRDLAKLGIRFDSDSWDWAVNLDGIRIRMGASVTAASKYRLKCSHNKPLQVHLKCENSSLSSNSCELFPDPTMGGGVSRTILDSRYLYALDKMATGDYNDYKNTTNSCSGHEQCFGYSCATWFGTCIRPGDVKYSSESEDKYLGTTLYQFPVCQETCRNCLDTCSQDGASSTHCWFLPAPGTVACTSPGTKTAPLSYMWVVCLVLAHILAHH